ncbi:N-acetylneuraminate synthase family protein [Candidatus Giovannonibacteria bacterium]|nr:N-acetylneuraminate synthase family protein [Candidatus Giovannonibacteria bacterium]
MEKSQRYKVGEKYIGEGEPCFIIAEAGLNHNGDSEIAKKLILNAKECGADAIKFQKRNIEDILVKKALDAPYDSPNAFAPTYGEHRNKLELSKEIWLDLKKFADENKIIFFASPWDIKSADFLEDLGVPLYKIASADLTNLPLLEHLAKKGKPLILSTGMSTLEEVDEAVNLILKFNQQLILMHCVSDYPCEDDKVNLRMISTLIERYKLPVGYSGHESGIAIPVAARALGAVAIEKHFTLSRAMKGSDHAGSLEPEGLRRLVKYIRKNVEPALGDGIKKFTEMERKMRIKLAKSLASTCPIPQGTLISADMLTIKGPGDGLKPSMANQVIGKIAKNQILADQIIKEDDIHWA